MKELFKEQIDYIYSDDENRFLVFIGWYDHYTYYASADYCSQSWFESINNPENLIGNTIIGIEEKPEHSVTNMSDDDEYIRIYGYTLKTEEGYTDIEMRNSSNGYYGGECEFIPGTTLVFPEIDDEENITTNDGKKIIFF